MPEPEKDREDHMDEREKRLSLWNSQGSTDTPAATESSTAQDLSEHIEELRNRILISVATLGVFVFLCFSFSAQIIRFLEAAAPAGSSFFQLKPGELFMSSLKVSLFFGLILSLPILLQQLGAFLSPGLKDKERKLIGPILWTAPILFLLGSAFGYYFALPPLLKFLLGFREGIVETRYGLEHFLNLEISIIGLCGIVFQLPILIVILTSLNLVNTKQLLSIWRYVVLFSFVLAAILTPTPDPLTMSIVASALLGLYFGTILIVNPFLNKTTHNSYSG